MVKRITLVFLCTFPFLSFSQRDTTLNIIDISYGANYNLKIDKTYSLLPRKGLTHAMGIQYENSNSNRMYSALTEFGIGELGTGANNVNLLTAYMGNVALTYIRKTNTISSKKIKVGFGGYVYFQAEVWFPKSSVLRYGWDTNLGGGFSFLFSYNASKKIRIVYNMDVSLLGVLWRSHNNGQQLTTEEIQLEKGLTASVFETPRFSHLFNTLYLSNQVRVAYSMNERINLCYRFNPLYRFITQPLVKKGGDFKNMLGIQFKF